MLLDAVLIYPGWFQTLVGFVISWWNIHCYFWDIHWGCKSTHSRYPYTIGQNPSNFLLYSCLYSYICTRAWIASYPGHVGGGKSGLVSTVCACANDSGNFSRTSPIMDKLHVVVMRRNNQTRYTACSVAAVFTRRWLPLSETQAVTRQGLRYNHRQFHRHCACSWNKRQSRSRWTSQIPSVATGIRLLPS